MHEVTCGQRGRERHVRQEEAAVRGGVATQGIVQSDSGDPCCWASGLPGEVGNKKGREAACYGPAPLCTQGVGELDR